MQNSGQGRPPIGRVFNPGNIPTELKALRRWAPWKAIWNEERGKWDKVPYRPEGYGLSSMQPGASVAATGGASPPRIAASAVAR